MGKQVYAPSECMAVTITTLLRLQAKNVPRAAKSFTGNPQSVDTIAPLTTKHYLGDEPHCVPERLLSTSVDEPNVI